MKTTHTQTLSPMSVLNVYAFFCISLLLTLYSTSLSPLYAQTIIDESASISISPDPLYPKPESSVTISLDDYSINSIGSTIWWYIDGVEQPLFKNQRFIEIQAGSLGSKKNISVRLARPNTPDLTASYILEPTIIDIILEAQTYVPHFYKGRALPSTQSSVRAVGVVHTGKSTDVGTYTYKWILDEDVIFGGAVKGKYAVDITVPRFNTGDLELEVYNNDGRLVGKARTLIHVTEPIVYFYENSPLRGLHKNALNNARSLSGEESTIFAEPFFLNTPILNNSSIEATWKFDKTKVQSDTGLPNAITVIKGNSEKQNRISFTASTLGNVPQYAQGSMMLSF